MSYRITEAERKHVAVTEDIELNLTMTTEAGTTPEVNLEITDKDQLNLSAKFPQYAIDIDKADDEHSRFRVVDAKTRETILSCDGLTSLNGNPMGLGWRYGLEFILDEDNYIKGLSLVNKNNGNRSDKLITKLADLEIKSVTIPESNDTNLVVKSKASFSKPVSIKTDSTEPALSVQNEKGKHAQIGGVSFNDTFAIETEGDTSLGTIKTKDIELVGEDSAEISIMAEITSIAHSKVSLSDVEIDGKETSSIKNVDSISAKNVNADNVSTPSLSASNGEITSLSSSAATIGSAEVTSINAVSENVTTLTSENVSANTISTDGITIHGKTRLEGDNYAKSMDVDGTLAAGKIKSFSSVEANEVTASNVSSNRIVANKVEAGVSEVITEKATSIETRNLTVSRQMDALKVTSRTDVDAARNVIAGNAIVSDIFKGKDGKVIAEEIDGDIALGNSNSVTVIKTRSDPEKGQLDEEFGHVKAIVDGREVFLANLEDVTADKFNGYVNRSTNQDISGVKTFNDVLVASAGIGVKDEEGHFRGVISHVEDYSDIEFKQNPKWLAAKEEADAYDALRSSYDHLKSDYSLLKSLKKDLEQADKELGLAESLLDNEQSDDAQLKSEKEKLIGEITKAEQALAQTSSNLSEKEGELAELQGAVSGYTGPYVKAQSDLDNEKADSEIMSIALRETLYFGKDFDDSYLKDNADYDYLSNGMNCTNLPYDVALEAFAKMIRVLDVLATSTQDSVVSYSEVTKEHIIHTLRPTIENNHAALVISRDEALADLNDAKDQVAAFESGELAEAQREKANSANKVTVLKANLSQIETDIEVNAIEIKRAEDKVSIATDNKTEKELDYSKAKTIYVQNYTSYSEQAGVTFTNDMIENGDIVPPSMSETVEQFKNNEIPQTDYQPSDTIHLGNSVDTLKIMSKGLHSNNRIDDHLQATIDGHDHILANADDILSKNVMSAFDVKYYDQQGKEQIDRGKIVGDVKTKQSDSGATIVIGQAEVISGYEGKVFPEDQKQPSKIEKEINIVSSDDSINITSTNTGLIDFSAGPLSERISHAIVDASISEEGTLKFTKEDGETKELLVVSTSDDLEIESLSDDIIDINMNNFYNKESVLKEDILRLYDNVQPSDLRKVANPFDVKVLLDSAEAKIDVLAKNLENRLPRAPEEEGRFFLVANVRSNLNGETTSTFTWDGTHSLPDVHIPSSIDDIIGSEDYDSDGNLYVPYIYPEYAEYMLKMRIIETLDDNGKKRYSPKPMWVRIDKGSDYNSELILGLNDNKFVVDAVSKGADQEKIVKAFIEKIDSDKDSLVSYKLYDFNDANEDPQGQHTIDCFKKERFTKIGATLADIFDFNTTNVEVLVDASDVKVNKAPFTMVSTDTYVYDLRHNDAYRLITSAEEAKDILITDGSLIGLINK